MPQMTYKWRQGARHQITPEVAAREVNRIRRKFDDFFSPAEVVDESRRASAPLHPEFEWDDPVAAEAWRVEQARKLIGDLIEIDESDPLDKPTRTFVSVRLEDVGPRFTQTRTALANNDMKEQVLRQAERDLEIFRAKYERYLDLSQTLAAFRIARVRAGSIRNADAA